VFGLEHIGERSKALDLCGCETKGAKFWADSLAILVNAVSFPAVFVESEVAAPIRETLLRFSTQGRPGVPSSPSANEQHGTRHHARRRLALVPAWLVPPDLVSGLAEC